MALTSVVAVAVMLVLYGSVSGLVNRSWLTAPLVFLAAGLLLGPSGVGLFESGIENEVLRVLAEATLTLTLFSDAVRLDVREVRASAGLPLRLLAIGLPLSILLGAVVGVGVLPSLGFVGAALLASLLAATDAALGQAVVTETSVPQRIRQTVNVESGLNDGLALPAVTVLLAAVGAQVSSRGTADWIGFAATQIGVGIAVGVAVGLVGGFLIDRGAAAGRVDGYFRQLGPAAVAVACYGGAELAGGNGFIAAFVGGAAFGAVVSTASDDVTDFMEDQSLLLSLVVFLLFGAEVLGPALETASWRVVTYALLSLTVVRMVSVRIALVGSGLRPVSVAYLGWFGPRGLASIVFVLLVAEELGGAVAAPYIEVVAITVGLSALLHGLSARPLSHAYARRLGQLRDVDESMTSMEDDVVA